MANSLPGWGRISFSQVVPQLLQDQQGSSSHLWGLCRYNFLHLDYQYYGDLWLFDTEEMEWKEIKTSGAVPHPRSGASLHYDFFNNRVILFGGRANDGLFFNDVHELDWSTKAWKQLFPRHQNYDKIE